MATSEQALYAAGVDWRTVQKYTKKQASNLRETVFTPEPARTVKQQRELFVAQEHARGRAARASNVSSVGGGRYHTSNGVRATGRR